ncbi:heme oxygenase-domain-containing protein [Radiomyces spectabilis]|uniref:heme oxygenase-domain-containing protein n=1 Tax=Radiomyces spectabilis TaxID=64574 RepID=UPI00221F2B37|nr:heme oxygenase-domain-containing protein [Radiomyces spectabilis]KAI8384436.1 heme oxygenase-domain-containing protein [Radiomyces spectabilis]
MPPHPGLDMISNPEELKHLCPAFASGCPYAKMEEVESVAVSFGELSKCPAFQKGCPFSNKSKEEISTMLSQIPKEHPVLNMDEIPSCAEGVMLVNLLNQFLTQAQLDTLFEKRGKPEEPVVPAEEQKAIEEQLLEDPQLASAMREGTKVVHRAAETSVFTKRFLKGDINKPEYGRYINSLYFVYQTMEELLEKHKANPVIELIHFPHELNRKEALLNDLEFYYGKDRVAGLIDPSTMTPAVKTYVQAMHDACATNPALLIAHSYSRYLGDLSGGQILAKRLKKHVFGMEEDDGSWDTKDGLNFYYFDNLGNQTEFKNFYRERLNAAKVDAKTRDLIVEEAVRSFELNIAVFDEIQVLSETGQLTPTVGADKAKKESVVEAPASAAAAPKETKGSCCSGAVQWVGVVAAAVAVAAVGAAVYQRYARQQ